MVVPLHKTRGGFCNFFLRGPSQKLNLATSKCGCNLQSRPCSTDKAWLLTYLFLLVKMLRPPLSLDTSPVITGPYYVYNVKSNFWDGPPASAVRELVNRAVAPY